MAYMLKESTVIREAFKNKIEKVVLILNSAHNQIMAKHGENETNPNLAEIQSTFLVTLIEQRQMKKGLEPVELDP